MNKLISLQLFKKLYGVGIVVILVGILVVFFNLPGKISPELQKENGKMANEEMAVDSFAKSDNGSFDEEYEERRLSKLPYVVAKRFYAEDLGIEFTYALRWPDSSDYEINPVQVGSIVYIDALPGEGGHSVEVFTKDSNISFEEALRRQFSLPQDCIVRSLALDFLLPGYNAAQIISPISIFEDYDAAAAKCSKYLQENGARYFMMNERVPDKFIFVDLGQYLSTSDGIYTPDFEGGDKPWNSSLRILH